MHTLSINKKQVAHAIGALMLSLGATQAFATAFQLNEQSGSGLGNAFAAGAAMTDDVSAMWWNPAALSQFPRAQGAAVLNIITPSIKFNNNASVPATNQPLGNNGGDAGGYNFVPNMYISVPINQQWTFGLGVNVPFGLTTEYDDGWIGRYQGLKSKIETININPALAWKITPQFSIGAGVSYQQIKATLTQNGNYSGLLLSSAASQGAPPATLAAIAGLTPGLDTKATITGNDWAWGWNIGLAWDATPQLRLGASYRSEIKYDVQGNINYENPTIVLPPGTPPQLAGTINALAAAINSQGLYGRGIQSDITVPQMANFSMLYRINPQWEVMADAQWTGWSSIPELKFNTTPTIDTVPLNWDDTWKLSLGASYKVSDQWKARFGVAFDQTPVTNDPTVRLPDSDRWWLTVGGEYKWTPNWKFDAGFAYIFADSPSFNQNQGNTSGSALVNGTYDASVWILSMQMTYTF